MKKLINGDEHEVHNGVLLGGGGATSHGAHQCATMFRCEKEHQFANVRGIYQPQAETPDYFAIGGLFHAGRARWFANKFATSDASWQSIRDAVEKAKNDNKLPISREAERRGLELLQMYVEHWSKRVFPKPIAAELKLGPTPLVPGDDSATWRTARLDDLSHYPEANGQLCIGEAKTTSTSVQETINEYELNLQTTLQYVLFRNDPHGEVKYGKCAGIMLDVVKKPYGKNKAQFGRCFVPISDYQIAWFIPELRTKLLRMAEVDWNAPAHRNISACMRKAGNANVACAFKDLCRFGKGATAKYVMNKGDSLLSWRPTPGKDVAPWE